ncbi:methyl-accepting chemotaxis protein, partial [Deinococcus piscis]|uniref:methyl-accepting chemotaxis protein n=1 Tax=Deinococcus piscis TaxID=394230 RepID=UPI0027E41526
TRYIPPELGLYLDLSKQRELPTTQPPTARHKGNFLSNLPVRHKIAAALGYMTLPFLGLGLTQLYTYYQDYKTAEERLEIVAAYTPMQELQKNLRYMRSLPFSQMGGQTEALQTNMNLLSQTLLEHGHDHQELQDVTSALQQKIERIVAGIQSGELSSTTLNSQVSSALNGELANLFGLIAEGGNLLAGTKDGTHAATDLAVLSTDILPVALPESSFQVQRALTALDEIRARDGVISEAQQVKVASLLERSEAATANIAQKAATMFEEYPDLASALKPSYDRMLAEMQATNDLIRAEMLDKNKTALTSAQVNERLNAGLDSQYQAFAATTKAMEGRLAAERDRARNNLLTILIGVILGALTLYVLTRVLSNAINQPLGHLTKGAQALSLGQFGARVPVTTGDEFGTLANTFNAAAMQLEANQQRVEQERLEQERLQNNIGQFLNVTMDIAEGDLTKRGTVTEDVLGNVVDSINLMTEELGNVLGDVQKASGSVTSGSRQMLSSTQDIQQGAAQTTQAALNVAQQTAEVNRQIQDMAQLAQATAEAARQALIAANQGRQAVQETLSGMQGIRTTAQTAEERIAALSERSKQIGQIVDTISGIASQTNLLSLHASIEAAGAGEAGERFSVVAEEVRQLADESAQATRQITTLISGIQSEIAEVVRTMRDNAAQVNQGYAVAGTAGERLEQIGELSRESARLAEQISLSTREQVQNIEQVSASAQDIAQTAERSQQSVEQGRAAADQLQRLADQLNASLSRFRLPG